MDNNANNEINGMPSLSMDNDQYWFLYKLNGDQYGPRSAKNMRKQNLPPDTPVTESSLGGKWYTAADFDFEALAQNEGKDEKGVDGTRLAIGAVVMLIGLGVTAATYSAAEGGGTYVIAYGAILFGFIEIIRGFSGTSSK